MIFWEAFETALIDVLWLLSSERRVGRLERSELELAFRWDRLVPNGQGRLWIVTLLKRSRACIMSRTMLRSADSLIVYPQLPRFLQHLLRQLFECARHPGSRRHFLHGTKL